MYFRDSILVRVVRNIRVGLQYLSVRRKIRELILSQDDCNEDVFSEEEYELHMWIEAIQRAPIVHLGPEDPWTEPDFTILVKRMKAQDLESQVDLPECEHEYEDYLDLIRSPWPIPTEKLSHAPHFLFIHPDEYALFKCFGQQDWCILTGNPGISKSWFQWKFIYFLLSSRFVLSVIAL